MKESSNGGLEAAAPSQTEPLFFDKSNDVRQHENRLPHWQQDERTYFLTFHLGDSIPRARLNEWSAERDAWQKWNPLPWLPEQRRECVERFANTMERWLDAGEGSCVLRRPGAAAILGNAFQHFEGTRCKQHAWIIMPNHVHLLFSLCRAQELPDLLRSWKSYSSRAINRLLNRSGTLWQKDYFDRLVRNSEHFWKCGRYIQNNPSKARLSPGQYLLYESDFVRDGLDWEGRLPKSCPERSRMGRPITKPKAGGFRHGGQVAAAAPSH